MGTPRSKNVSSDIASDVEDSKLKEKIASITFSMVVQHMVKFHEDAYWQKVMSLFHGQSKLSHDLNIYRNCMGSFSSVKI